MAKSTRPRLATAAGAAAPPHRPVGYEAASKDRGLLVVLQGGPGMDVHREQVLLLQHSGAAGGPQLLAQRLEAQRVAGRGAAALLHAVVACSGRPARASRSGCLCYSMEGFPASIKRRRPA